MKRVKKGKIVDFSGVLTEHATAGPLANRQIILIGNSNIIGVDRTGCAAACGTSTSR